MGLVLATDHFQELGSLERSLINTVTLIVSHVSGHFLFACKPRLGDNRWHAGEVH